MPSPGLGTAASARTPCTKGNGESMRSDLLNALATKIAAAHLQDKTTDWVSSLPVLLQMDIPEWQPGHLPQ